MVCDAIACTLFSIGAFLKVGHLLRPKPPNGIDGGKRYVKFSYYKVETSISSNPNLLAVMWHKSSGDTVFLKQMLYFFYLKVYFSFRQMYENMPTPRLPTSHCLIAARGGLIYTILGEFNSPKIVVVWRHMYLSWTVLFGNEQQTKFLQVWPNCVWIWSFLIQLNCCKAKNNVFTKLSLLLYSNFKNMLSHKYFFTCRISYTYF